MISSQAQNSTQFSQETHQTWRFWKSDHPELQRYDHSTIILNNINKVLIVGGYKSEQGVYSNTKALNILLIDPQSQNIKILPPTPEKDAELCCWALSSACYWKDSKVVVCGGYNPDRGVYHSTVAIITLKDLESETPSAHWEKVKVIPEIARAIHSAYIYKDKMYVLGGYEWTGLNLVRQNNIWCLDLTDFTWTECKFSGDSLDLQVPNESRIFHEDKIYIVDCVNPTLTIYEFDLETMICTKLVGPGLSRSAKYTVCPQLVDEKICLISVPQSNPKIYTYQAVEVWTYDLNSEEWTEKKTKETVPSYRKDVVMLICEDQLILYGGKDRGLAVFGEFWSLPLEIPKTKKQVQPIQLTPLQTTMKRFLEEAPYSDISFEVESQVIPAHKWWLSRRSKYFANMFSSGMLEAQVSTIIITDITATAFRALLEFLYTDHIELNEALALELLREADKYSVAELKKVCEAYLAENLKPENYVEMAQMAELVDGILLKQAIVNYIAKYFRKLKQRKDFEQIPESLLNDSTVQCMPK